MSKGFKFFIAILLASFLFAFFMSYSIGGNQKTFSFYVIHTYYSGDGTVPPLDLLSYEHNKKKCSGVSFLLNKGAVEADAIGISLCLGFLK